MKNVDYIFSDKTAQEQIRNDFETFYNHVVLPWYCKNECPMIDNGNENGVYWCDEDGRSCIFEYGPDALDVLSRWLKAEHEGGTNNAS